MEDFKPIVESLAKEGKIPLPVLCERLKLRFRLPERTYYWYVSEGLLPKAEVEGRDGFYTPDVAQEVFEKLYIIKELKEYSTIRVNAIRTIFNNYIERRRLLIDRLASWIEEFPAFIPGNDPDYPFFSAIHAKIIQAICRKLEQGKPLEEIKVLDIDKSVTEKE